MSKQVKLERKAIRLYAKPYNSNRGVMAIQYENDFIDPLQEGNPDNRPIYVGFDGEVGRPLEEVLRENSMYHSVVGDSNLFKRTEDLRRDVDSQIRMIQVANDRITQLETMTGLAQRLKRAFRRHNV